MKLVDDLLWLSGRWVEEHRRTAPAISLKTLSSRATNDGKLFTRIQAQRPITIPIFEACVAYLALGKHWPAGSVPTDVLQRLVALGADVGPHSVAPIDRRQSAQSGAVYASAEA